jgi:hypothetical protein
VLHEDSPWIGNLSIKPYPMRSTLSMTAVSEWRKKGTEPQRARWYR